MYELWKEKRISKPSEYWNYSLGDKIFTRAFWDEYVTERNRKTSNMKRDEIPVFSVMPV